MEREVALRKLELNRVQTKKTLRSVVQTLISGKKKINYEGKKVDVVLEEEIEELQRRSRVNFDVEVVRKCSNFDKKASVLQRKLETLGFEEKCVKEIRGMAESRSLSIKTSCRFNGNMISNPHHRESHHRFTDVEILGNKMEGLSKGMLERMEEEYRSMLYSSSSSSTSSSTSASAASSTSTSNRFEFPSYSSSSRFVHQDHRQEMMFREDKVCSGRCKAIVRKIVEQVRGEMDQWSQMQDMLGRVREEMEELQSSRDFWQNRALDSDDRVQSLQSAVQEWKQKAQSNETKVSELEKQVSDLHIELGRLKTQRNSGSSRPRSLASTPLIDLYAQKEKEKRVLICSLKENHNSIRNSNKQMNKEYYCDEDGRRKGSVTGNSRIRGPKRSPFREIENSSNNMGLKRLPFRDIDQNSMSPTNRQLNNMGLKRSPFGEIENSSSPIYHRLHHISRGGTFPWH